VRQDDETFRQLAGKFIDVYKIPYFPQKDIGIA